MCNFCEFYFNLPLHNVSPAGFLAFHFFHLILPRPPSLMSACWFHLIWLSSLVTALTLFSSISWRASGLTSALSYSFCFEWLVQASRLSSACPEWRHWPWCYMCHKTSGTLGPVLGLHSTPYWQSHIWCETILHITHKEAHNGMLQPLFYILHKCPYCQIFFHPLCLYLLQTLLVEVIIYPVGFLIQCRRLVKVLC